MSHLRYGVNRTDNGWYMYDDASSVTDYVLQTGDYLRYGILLEENTNYQFGFDLTASSGFPLRDSGAVDQNALSAHPSTDLTSRAFGQWYDRVIALSPMTVGATVSSYDFVRNDGSTGDRFARFRNIQITDSAGAIRKNIWTSGDSLPTKTNHFISGTPTSTLTLVTEAPPPRRRRHLGLAMRGAR